MRILVCYDIRTATTEGEKRLRRVARVCVNHGQRVQKSVFECLVSESLLETFRKQLLDILDPTEDSLRMYRLPEKLGASREVHGVSREVDFGAALVL